MFTQSSVVLVGAGASAEFGLPTGIGLYNSAAKEEEADRAPFGDLVDRLFYSFWEFLKFHNMAAEQDQFRQLVRQLRNSHAYSIDLFAYYNPSFSKITKLYTAWKIVRDMFSIEQEFRSNGDVRQFVDRHYNWRNPQVGEGDEIRNNWIGELVNVYLRGAKNQEDLERNKLTFVTFNYDPVLEETFSHIVRLNERFREVPDHILPSIIHVHGAMESPTRDGINKHFYEEQSERIKFINDTIEQPSEEVLKARAALDEARRVYSVGFAFEELNVDLLAAGKWGARTVALNYDGNTKVTSAMQRVGVRSADIWLPNGAPVLSAGLAASRGFFDANPGR